MTLPFDWRWLIPIVFIAFFIVFCSYICCCYYEKDKVKKVENDNKNLLSESISDTESDIDDFFEDLDYII